MWNENSFKKFLKEEKPRQCLKSIYLPPCPIFYTYCYSYKNIITTICLYLTFSKYPYIPVLNYKVPNYDTLYSLFSLFIINNILKICYCFWEMVEIYKYFEFLCQFKQVTLLCTDCFPIPFPLIQELNCYVDAFSFSCILLIICTC